MGTCPTCRGHEKGALAAGHGGAEEEIGHPQCHPGFPGYQASRIAGNLGGRRAGPGGGRSPSTSATGLPAATTAIEEAPVVRWAATATSATRPRRSSPASLPAPAPRRPAAAGERGPPSAAPPLRRSRWGRTGEFAGDARRRSTGNFPRGGRARRGRSRCATAPADLGARMPAEQAHGLVQVEVERPRAQRPPRGVSRERPDHGHGLEGRRVEGQEGRPRCAGERRSAPRAMRGSRLDARGRGEDGGRARALVDVRVLEEAHADLASRTRRTGRIHGRGVDLPLGHCLRKPAEGGAAGKGPSLHVEARPRERTGPLNPSRRASDGARSGSGRRRRR